MNEHKDGIEVLPDAYKLSMSFKSCLANNLNTSVFQYFVKMATYEDYSGPGNEPGSVSDDTIDEKTSEVLGGLAQSSAQSMKSGVEKMKSMFGKGGPSARDNYADTVAGADLLDGDGDSEELTSNEKFHEATYNKRIGKLNSKLGDEALNSDSVVNTIHSIQKVIRESMAFLKRLYNAETNNLWYMPIPSEELYTTIEPDYRSILRRKYKESIGELRNIDSKMNEINSQISDITRQLAKATTLSAREPLIEEKVKVLGDLQDLQAKRDKVSDEILQIDIDLIQAARDDHDETISVKKNPLTTRIFKQVWNEKIMNSYERNKLQYLTSEEKERYFKEKVRELRKTDPYGILNHEDWFFRVVVLDYIVQEMRRLMMWFKECTYGDFETIYRIVRKLRILLLDVEQIRSESKFEVNHTNLFYISENDAKNFTKLDSILTGNTLYELFMGQLRLNFIPESLVAPTSTSESATTDLELVQEQNSEKNLIEQRKVRQDVVVRFWGNEANLTKAAYELVNVDDDGSKVKVVDENGNVVEWRSIREMKNRII